MVAVGVGNTGVDEGVKVSVGEGISVDVAVGGSEVAVGGGDSVGIDVEVDVGDIGIAVGTGVVEGSAGVTVGDGVRVGVRVAVAGAVTAGLADPSNRAGSDVAVDSDDSQEASVRTDINAESNKMQASFIRGFCCDR